MKLSSMTKTRKKSFAFDKNREKSGKLGANLLKNTSVVNSDGRSLPCLRLCIFTLFAELNEVPGHIQSSRCSLHLLHNNESMEH